MYPEVLMSPCAAVPKIVVTGGPCGGKSSSLSYLSRHLGEYGFQPYIAKEAATVLIEQGMRIKQAVAERDWVCVARYQREILEFHLHNEDQLQRIAHIDGHAKPIMLCDRGALDGRAYLEEGPKGDKQFKGLLKEFGYNPLSVLERYVGVIHMLTAAVGKPDFYTCANNAARDETLEQAKYLDCRIQAAWLMHRKLRVIDNSRDFAGKLHCALQAACHVLDIPKPLRVQRKYALKPPAGSIPVPHERMEIEQAYLHAQHAGEQVRVRKCGKNGSALHYFARRRLLKDGIVEGAEELISSRRYASLLAGRNPAQGIITKERIVFLWQHQYCKLDLFSHPALPAAILEVESTEFRNQVMLPPFLNIAQDVTNNPEYGNYALSFRINQKGVPTQ